MPERKARRRMAHNIAQISGWPPSMTKIERKENDGTLAALRDHRTRTLAGIKGLGGTTEKPRFFRNKFDATCWLKRPIPEPSAEDIAKQFGLKVEDVIAGRNKAKAWYRLCKARFDH